LRAIGLDLGQSHDPAAAAVVDRVTSEPLDFIGPANPNFKPRTVVRSLRQWPLGTDYMDIVEDVLSFPVDVIVVDFGGVGRPVVDIMRRRATEKRFTGKIKPVQLIGSNARATQKREARGVHWNVPKIDVITSILLAQQDGSLWLPKDAKETAALFEQLRIFQMKVTKAANLQFGNAPGGHDDLIVALGLACWWCRRFGSMKPAVWC